MQGPIRLGVTVFLSMAATASAFGYESDVHFSLTFAICRMSGFEHRDALLIASADQRVDENDTTTAAMAIATDPRSKEASKRRLWHALDDSRQAVLVRLAELRERAAREKSLVYLGQYLHFLQDHFSHRESKGENWKPYGWKIGHAMRAHQPDRVPNDIKLAREMTLATFEAAADFARRALGREPPVLSESTSEKIVAALSSAYSQDALGFWNESDSYRVAIKLEAALDDMGMTEEHIPHISRIIKMRFDPNGNRVDK